MAVGLMVAMLGASCERGTPVAPVAPGLADTGRSAGVSGEALSSGVGSAAAKPPAVPTKVIPPADKLTLPPQMVIGVFASGLVGIRELALSPSGELFAALPRANTIVVLPDDDADGVADTTRVYAAEGGLNLPSGLGFVADGLLVANTDGLLRFDYALGDRAATGPPRAILALPGQGQAPYRPVVIGADGRAVVGIGASCSACDEADERRASLLAVPIDGGSAPLRLAYGLHAPQGLAKHAASGRIWVSESSRFGLGDGIPPDEINRVEPGRGYGWPQCYGVQLPDPSFGIDPSVCAGTVPPAVSLPAHVTPAGMTFTDGATLAPEHRNGLLVALEGSTLTRQPVGFAVVFLPFDADGPTGEVRPFIHGWLRPDTTRWGRPTDVEIGSDGAVYVADEGAGIVYRAAYLGRYATPTPLFRER